MRRSRILGQYFTPEPVVDLCYRMLSAADPDTRSPLIIDPACGEGAFLNYTLKHGLTSGDRLFGFEKDPSVAESCRAHLGESANICIGDGLTEHAPQADWVVGNPPYGTLSLKSDGSLDTLKERYTIWEGAGRPELDLSKYPVELLFLERCVELCRPFGFAALVAPDGILSNSRLAYAREWLYRHADVRAVVSLPRRTFKRLGADIKSSILLFRKEPATDRPVFMAAPDSPRVALKMLPMLAEAFSGGFPGPPPWLVLRIDKPAPGERLDPAYYHPKFTENLRALSWMKNVVRLGDLITHTAYGQVGARALSEAGVRVLTPANLPARDGFVTGVDTCSLERFTMPGSWNDPRRSRLTRGDLLLVNSGVGCIGRAAVYYGDEPANVSQHINVVRLRHLEPEYLAVYLQTSFARLQIEQGMCGVGPSVISIRRIKSLLVPVLPPDARRAVAKEYRRIALDSPDGTDDMRRLVRRLEDIALNGLAAGGYRSSPSPASET